MPSLAFLLYWIGIFVLSMGLTRLMMVWGPRWGLVDQPDERRIHQRPIPRAGGLAVFGAMAVGFTGLWLLEIGFVGELGHEWLRAFTVAAALLVGVGVVDDRRSLSPWVKLGGQAAAALIMFFFSGMETGQLMGWEVPWPIDLGVNVLWMVTLINAYNLIDGMDGLCAGLGLISLLILGGLAAVGPVPENALVIAVMGAAVAGFLRYNFYPARIFLGDAGSMLIGFFIASAGMVTVGRHAVTSGVLLPLLVAGVPLFDVVLAVWRRSARKLAAGGEARVFGPDKDHLHHRFLKAGLSQRQAAIVMYALALVAALVALIPMMGGANYTALSVVGFLVILLIGLHYLAPVEFVESGRGLRALIRRPRSFRKVILLYFAYDAVVLLGAMLAAEWLVAKENGVEPEGWALLMPAAIYAACTLAGLAVGGAHVRRWMRAGVQDFMECSLWLMAGTGVSLGLMLAVYHEQTYRVLLSHCCALLLGGTAVFAFRAAGLSLLEGVVTSLHGRKRFCVRAPEHKVLLYGAGDLGELFAANLRLSAPERWEKYHFLGYLDDAEEMRGRRLRGFPILGSCRELPEIARKTGATMVVVTLSRLTPEQWEALAAQCARCSLKLCRWIPELLPQPVALPPCAEGEPAPEPPAALLPGRSAAAGLEAPPLTVDPEMGWTQS